MSMSVGSSGLGKLQRISSFLDSVCVGVSVKILQ
jgi:hypothetical protein